VGEMHLPRILLQLALIRDSEGESMKQAKKKRIKQLVVTCLGLALIVAFMSLVFLVTHPIVAGGG